MIRPFDRIVHELRESLTMALVSVKTNRLRSSLTLLGISIGVFSIIAVMTAMGVLVNGIENGISQLGAHTFQIQRMPMMRSNDPQQRAKLRNRKFLKFEEGIAVKERTTLAKAVGLEAWDFGKVVASPLGTKTNPNVQICGEDIDGFATNDWTISEGRLFTQDELNSG